MRYCKVCLCVMVFWTGLIAWGCSRGGHDDQGASEPSVLEQTSQRTADTVVGAVQQPLKKARGVQDLAEQHARDLEASR
jgi:hypothetical protein